MTKIKEKETPKESDTTERTPCLTTAAPEAPNDKWNLVYFIFLLHGVGILMPWNMFTTADAYFREVKLHNSVYARDFQSYLGVSSQIPNLLFSLINLYIQLKGRLTIRMLAALTVVFLAFLLTISLAAVETDGHEATFFAVTMASVIVINCAIGVYQNSCFGLATDLPMKYNNTLLIGNNICGTLVAVIGLISMSSSPDKTVAALLYFSAALILLIMCIASTFILQRSKFYCYYSNIGDLNRSSQLGQSSEIAPYGKKVGPYAHFVTYLKRYWDVVKLASTHMFNVFFVFFVTLSVYPAVIADIRPSRDDFWLPADDKNNKNYFRAVGCFLSFNFFAMLGSLTCNWIRVPGPRLLWIPITLRAIFIPFFLFCNYRPASRALPVFIYDDHVYMLAVVLFAFTSGYFGSVAMMYTPGAVPADKARIAGMMAGFFLIFGICSGVNFTFVLSTLAGIRNNTAVTEDISSTLSTVLL